MDTTTVLEIIKMIDAHSSTAYDNINKAIASDKIPCPYDVGTFEGLSRLSEHLQQCIEGQLNAAENQTAE